MINDAKEIQAAQNSIITNGDDSVSRQTQYVPAVVSDVLIFDVSCHSEEQGKI